VKGVSSVLRRLVRNRAGDCCEYCRSCAELTGHDFTVDHIIPESRGGAKLLPNLSWCCFWCNSFKQARTHAPDPRNGRRVALFHPRQDIWHEHFRWNRAATRIIARSAVGRATIAALRLNRPTLVRARRIWVRHGLHPPQEEC
jgi:hypothetical protein